MERIPSIGILVSDGNLRFDLAQVNPLKRTVVVDAAEEFRRMEKAKKARQVGEKKLMIKEITKKVKKTIGPIPMNESISVIVPEVILPDLINGSIARPIRLCVVSKEGKLIQVLENQWFK